MKFLYQARFVPKGVTDVESASKTRTTQFISDNQTPDPEDIKKANIEIQQEFDDPYVARNYWELHDILIRYNDPPWKSIDELEKTIYKFTGPGRNTRYGSRYEEFVSIDHKPSMSSDDIADFLDSEYDIPIDRDSQIESVSKTTTDFYTGWTVEL